MTFKLEYNDFRAFITLVNVILIMVFGLSFCWLGLAVAMIGLVKDATVDKKINGFVMHGANAILNIYLLTLL